MAPAFKLTVKRQIYATVIDTMIRLSWAWLKFSGILEEGRVGKAEQIRECVREMVAFGLTLKNQLD